MATIGIDSITGMGVLTLDTTTKHRLLNGGSALYDYTPISNETLTDVGIHTNSSDTGSIQVGVYRTDTYALVASAVVSGAGAGGRKTTSLSGSLSAGVTYAVGWRIVSNISTWGTPETDALRNSALTSSSALADPFVPDGTFGGQRYPIFAITVEGGDVTPPTFESGPTASNIAATTFDIGGTSNESGTASLLVTASGASQPSDGEFDGSSESESITASTPFTIEHTGETGGELRRAWVQLIDGSDNRATDSVLVLLPQANFETVVVGTPNTTAANRITAVADIASGDTVSWGNIQGTGTVVVNDDGTFDADSTVTAFDVYVGNTTDGWGTVATQTIGGDSDSGAGQTGVGKLKLAIRIGI